jgi:hypothetical protein
MASSSGEHTAKAHATIRCVALRTCVVSFTDHRGARHTVEVSAESLYEAVALGLQQLRACEWVDVIGPAARLEVETKAVATRHEVTLAGVRRWCESSAASPEERMRKDRVKAMLVAAGDRR